MNPIKFQNSGNSEFSKTLHTRVNDYFKVNQKKKFGGRQMVIKTIFMLSLFFIPLGFIGSGLVSNVWLLFGLYILSGFGMSGIGMGVMHDAIHGSYSKNPKVNKYLGYTMNLIGANASVWRVQHNVLHHTYTNIDHGDDDINAPFFLRFSPNAKRYWIHRFQHFYIWFFYGLSTISWITTKDFVRAVRYRKIGLLKGNFKQVLMKISGWKVLYYSYALVLPLIMVPLPAWIILLAFLSMHFVTGLFISMVFQTAHILEETSFPQPDTKGMIDDAWVTHQLATTSNYAPKSRILSWFIGGLNFQVEHHLFPHISHVHYRNISKIVAQTASEFKIPYLVNPTFINALSNHVKMLRQLGRA